MEWYLNTTGDAKRKENPLTIKKHHLSNEFKQTLGDQQNLCLKLNGTNLKFYENPIF
jgi:hypothetical protein